jgi:hypothetical protein
MLLHEVRKAILDDGSPGASEDVSDEENVQNKVSGLRGQVLG